MLNKNILSFWFLTGMLLYLLSGCSGDSGDDGGQGTTSQADASMDADNPIDAESADTTTQDSTRQDPSSHDAADVQEDMQDATPDSTHADAVDMDAVDMEDVEAADQGMTQPPAKLRIATWNVSRLDVEGEGENPRVEADYALLRGYMNRLDADIIALQEVRGITGTQTVFPAADWSAECEDRNSAQNICVVARRSSDWTLTRNADLVTLNAGDPNLRQGLDLTIAKPGHEPLRVLVVHLKFGCFTGEADNNANCGTFFNQIEEIEAWIDARTTADEAFAVLGDFNRFMTANDSAWLELDDADPMGADLTRSIPQGTPTPCWSDVFTEFIDHIALGLRATSWLEASEQIAYDETDFDTYSQRLSDHCPLWADLEVPVER